MPEIASLSIADPPALWEGLGFEVQNGACWVGRIRHDLGAEGRGVVAWRLRGGADSLVELPVAREVPSAVEPAAAHPNGVLSLDHVVIATPDLHRTVAAFEAAGVALRRTRETGTADRPGAQAFFRLGEAIAEVVGRPDRRDDGPARFYGLAFTVADLDATAAYLGERLRPAKAAVQPGRRIATLDRSAGSSVPIAFMSQEPGRPGG